MNEGGQSSTGQLIDFMIKTHPAYPELVEVSKKENKNMFDVLGELLERLRVERGEDNFTALTRDLHLVSLSVSSIAHGLQCNGTLTRIVISLAFIVP